MRIDYCQDDTYKYCPDNSFSDEVWKSLFEYDESVWSLYRRQNRSPQCGIGRLYGLLSAMLGTGKKVVVSPVDDTIDCRWIRKREAVMRNPFMFMSVFTAPGIDNRPVDDHREVSDRMVEQYRMMRRGIAFESAMSEARTHGLR